MKSIIRPFRTPSLRLCVCLPGLGLTACVAAAREYSFLDSDRGLNRGVRVIPFEGEVFVAEIFQGFHRRIE